MLQERSAASGMQVTSESTTTQGEISRGPCPFVGGWANLCTIAALPNKEGQAHMRQGHNTAVQADSDAMMQGDSSPGGDDKWKEKVAQAMHAKFGKRLSNEFIDGKGEPQWASKELMRISREMCLANLSKDRLPKHNPYVQNFHRGISVSNATHPTWDLQVQCHFRIRRLPSTWPPLPPRHALPKP